MTGQLLAAADLAATAVALATMVVLHVLPTGLSALRHPVSQYGITRYRAGYRVLTVALGVAGLAAAAAAAATTYPPNGRVGIVAPLVIFGICRLAISWYPMDPPGAPRTTHGSIHIALAIGAFLTAAIAANRMRHAAGELSQVSAAYGGALTAAFWLLVIGLAGQFLIRWASPRHHYYGAAERVVYLGIYLLLTATALTMI